jgi:hypothetical protein
LSAKLKAQNEAGKAQFKEGQGRMGLAGLANALIAAGEATRGQKGSGFGEAMGGFGKSYGKFTEEDVKRIQAQQALERQQEIEVGKLDSDIEALRQAYAKAQIESRFTDAANYQKAIAERVARKQALQVGAAEKGLNLLGQEDQRNMTGAYQQSELQLRREANQQNAAHQADIANLEGRKLDALIANNASQRDIDRQRLKLDEATKNSQLALHRAQIDEVAATRRERIEATARGKLDDAMKGDSRITMLSKRLNDPLNPVEIGSDEYEKIMTEVGKIRREIMTEHPEFNIPDASGTPKYAKNDKGEVIVSYDNFKTHQPVKRTVTGGR